MKDDRPSDALFLLPRSSYPCGVEAFARRLGETARRSGLRAADFELTGARNLLEAWSRIGAASSIVVNLPVVAWKRVLVAPLLALLFARLRGRRNILVLHEWDDLDWRRRLVYAPYVQLSDVLIFSSPMVRQQFRASRIGRNAKARDLVVPIPSNIQLPLRLVPNRFQKRLAEHRAKGGVVLGHFGSIYPKKHSEMVLEVASELQRRGHDVLAVCIGSFIKGQDRVEEDFRNKCRQLKLEERTVVTGYVDSPAELFAIFSEVDAFVYSFDEGLTSRRGSVLACLQSGKPVVVNAPKDPGEFDHHPAFGQAMSSGGLQFVAHGGDASGYAERIELLLQNPRASITFDFEACWQAANLVLQDALSGREPPLARQGTAYEPTSVSRGGAAGADRR